MQFFFMSNSLFGGRCSAA